MPELPEVETVRRGLAERVIGDRIESVWLSEKPQPFKSPPREIARALQGARIVAVRRMGKHIIVDLEGAGTGAAPLSPVPETAAPRQRAAVPSALSPVRKVKTTCAASLHTTIPDGGGHPSVRHTQWIVHLGMTGALQVTPAGASVLKHTQAILGLESGREIRFVDPRRFGRMWVASGFETHGVEPLHVAFEDFARLFRGRKTPIKSALLNQKLLRGLGNIYADESLFRAGVRPRRRAGSLTREELLRLHRAIRAVLRAAIAAGGSSISDYFDVEGEPGLFQTRHRVYGRGGEPCLMCRAPIKRVVVAGRGTHYCPRCQK